MSKFPAFPDKPGNQIKTPAFLKERGFSLRYASSGDMPGLRALYADTRTEEMSAVPWPALAKRQFLDQQFDLQHRHYLEHFAEADFMAIEYKNTLQGRYYLLRTAPDHLIVDICLMTEKRGQGIGRALIMDSMQEARALGRGMHLHVLKYNARAQRLYENLGFIVCADADMYRRMRWAPDVNNSAITEP